MRGHFLSNKNVAKYSSLRKEEKIAIINKEYLPSQKRSYLKLQASLSISVLEAANFNKTAVDST